jgi:peptide/nickel transport system ATP-binding protein
MKLLISLLENVGILLITHDMELARWASDRIIDLGVGIHGNTTP